MNGERVDILVVENEDDQRDQLESYLRNQGYLVASASDGEQALHYLQTREPPSLILLDFDMPNMDGFEFRARQLRDPRFRQVAVVFMTAITSIPEQREDAEQVYCLKKPFDAKDLLDVVSRYCSQSTVTR